MPTDEKLRAWPVRFYIYQKERFPVPGMLLLIAAFTFSAASYSRICRHAPGFVPWRVLFPGIATSFLLFFLLRLFDECKDAEDDARFRPYRAVPRGLVSLREIGRAIVLSIAAAVCLNAWAMPVMLYALGAALGYLLLMWREFFVPKWLRRHPVAYLISHMLIMPVIDFYTTGLDWMNQSVPMPKGLFVFLCVTFLNGCVIEIGRKIRAPDKEESGVETYSFLWGPRRAAWIWLAILLLTGILAFVCCLNGGYGLAALPFLLLWLVLFSLPALRFLKTGRNGERMENAAGGWTVAMYVTIGGMPMLLEQAGSLWR